MRYIIYLRVSTEKQDIHVQSYHCIEYIKTIHDFETGSPEYLIFSDDDVSARKVKLEKRQGLQDALQTLKKGDTLITTSFDRLGRNIYECAKVREQIIESKCKLIAVNDLWVQDEFLFGIRCSIAVKELELLRTRTSNGITKKRAEGKLIGKTPYGYKHFVHPTELTKKDKPQKYLQINPEEKSVLEMMLDLKSQGFSFREITDELARKGITNRHGRRWQPSSVYEIIKNHKHQPQESVLQSLSLS